MAPAHLRQFGRRSDYLIYWSERLGARQICHIDLKSGESRQLTEVTSLDVSTISLTADERSVMFFNGPALSEVSGSSGTVREVYKLSEGATRGGFTHSADGSVFFTMSTEPGKSQLMRSTRLKTAPVLQADGDIDFLSVRPRRAQILYRNGGALWLLNTDGTNVKKQLPLQEGQTGEILWSPSGRTLIYLHVPDDPKQLITLREHTPDDGSDRELARTSQFQSFGPNSDASVFAGASRSRASAYVLILLRVTRRELTLCEHRASDPGMVAPMFSPDSQSVFFVSDRHGKSAIYRIRVDKFVEETADSN